jgi:nucleoside-diphosphate-sugar epimerase
LDVVKDPEFLEQEDYALPKARCEDFLRTECIGQNWTIVRPVISFSSLRLDFYMYSKTLIPDRAKAGIPVIMPEFAKKLTAGLDWAGNSGKLIANLLLKPQAMGETFTIYSGHGMTWGQVADAYRELTGVKIRWCSLQEYEEGYLKTRKDPWIWKYDRVFNRDVDCSKVLRVTGLKREDFATIREGIQTELDIIQHNVTKTGAI